MTRTERSPWPAAGGGFGRHAHLPLFDGATYSTALDGERLDTQLERVKALMSDGKWRTLKEIHAACGGSEAGVSARLRDLRKSYFGVGKDHFGGHTVERRRRGAPESGLWEYRLILRGTQSVG